MWFLAPARFNGVGISDIGVKKENIVKSGTALENKSETKVSNYISGEWAQKVTITMRAEDVNYNNSKTNQILF